LFVKEAFQNGNFARIVVSEIDPALVKAVRENGGRYCVNIAGAKAVRAVEISGLELLNPGTGRQRKLLVKAIAETTEITTSLPSVDYYRRGGAESCSTLIAQGCKMAGLNPRVIYTAENHNRAAELLEQAVNKAGTIRPAAQQQYLNTVIGKMSRVVCDRAELRRLGLQPIAPGLERAFLVEEFNRILTDRVRLEGFQPGIGVFVEKDDLAAFEEAKLYGHNAVHAVLAYVGALRGCETMPELKSDKVVMEIGRGALLNECGRALVLKFGASGDELFTAGGFQAYAEDLLERMTNPYLGDTIARAGRDVLRKLGLEDRLFGTMALALEYDVEPRNIALGAMAAVAYLAGHGREYALPEQWRLRDWRKLRLREIEGIIRWVWGGRKNRFAKEMFRQVAMSREALVDLAGCG